MDRSVFAITWLRAGRIYWAHFYPAVLLLGLWILVAIMILVVGAWSMKRALQVRYGKFVVDVTAVDPASGAGTPSTATLTERHTLPVFWAMFWRGGLLQFLERRYGPLQARVLLNAIDAPAPADDPEMCTATVVSIEYALALPSPDREDMIRMIFQAGALESPEEPAQSAASAPLKL